MSQSGMIKNTDFSADLLLNKIMTGQYRTQNNNSITIAGRMNAAHLDSTATKLNIEAETARKGMVLADSAANGLSEILERVRDFAEINTTLTGSDLQSAASEVQSQLTTLIGTQVNGTSVLGGETNVLLGQGDTTGVKVGLDLANETAYKAFTEALTDLVDNGTAIDDTVIKSAINELMVNITNEAGKSNVLENRYNSLNDLANSYHDASDDQVVTAGGNSTLLINKLLG